MIYVVKTDLYNYSSDQGVKGEVIHMVSEDFIIALKGLALRVLRDYGLMFSWLHGWHNGCSELLLSAYLR